MTSPGPETTFSPYIFVAHPPVIREGLPNPVGR